MAVLATVHGSGRDDLQRRPVCRALLSAGVFRRALVIQNRDGVRTVKAEGLA